MYRVQTQPFIDGLWHDSVDINESYQDIAKAEADIMRYGQRERSYRVVEWCVASVMRFTPPTEGQWDVKRTWPWKNA